MSCRTFWLGRALFLLPHSTLSLLNAPDMTIFCFPLHRLMFGLFWWTEPVHTPWRKPRSWLQVWRTSWWRTSAQEEDNDDLWEVVSELESRLAAKRLVEAGMDQVRWSFVFACRSAGCSDGNGEKTRPVPIGAMQAVPGLQQRKKVLEDRRSGAVTHRGSVEHEECLQVVCQLFTRTRHGWLGRGRKNMSDVSCELMPRQRLGPMCRRSLLSQKWRYGLPVLCRRRGLAVSLQ